MTATNNRFDVRRMPGGAIDIEFYEARARRARADVFQDVARHTWNVTRSIVRPGVRHPKF